MIRSLLFCFLLTAAKASVNRPIPRSKDPNYQTWLESYDGKEDPFSYNLAAFSGNRHVNRNKPHELAKPHQRPVPSSFAGNFRVEYSPLDIRGFQQPLLMQGGQSLGFEPRGQEVLVSKRFSRPEDRLEFRLEVSSLSADDSFTKKGTWTLTDGRRLTNLQGNLDFKEENLRLQWSWQRHQSLQSSYRPHAGVAVRRLEAKSRIKDPNQFQNYHLKQWAILPFIGLEGETPLSRSVHLYARARLSYGFSKSETSRRSGSAPINVQNSRRKRDYLESDLEGGLAFFWDRTHRLYGGWQYRHKDFPSLQGPTGLTLQELSWSGPKIRLDFLF